MILGVLLVAATVAIYLRVGASLGPVRNAVLLVFRLLGLLLVLALLLQPSRVEEIPPPITNRVVLVGVDDSRRSMAQKDVEQGTRTQAARSILAESGITQPDGTASGTGDCRLFKFGEDAGAVPNTAQLDSSGATTHVHHSLTTMLNSLAANEGARAAVLLTDGHDFELVNPAKTGFAARQRQTPIYAVALGKQGKVRDVLGADHELPALYLCETKGADQRGAAADRLRAGNADGDLLRADKVVQSRKVQTGEEPEMAVSFEVIEPAVGQYEYEVRVRPVEGRRPTRKTITR